MEGDFSIIPQLFLDPTSPSFDGLFPCPTEPWGDLPFQFNDSEDMMVYNFLHDAVNTGWSPLDLTATAVSSVKSEPGDPFDLVPLPTVEVDPPEPVRITAKRREVPDSVSTSRDSGSMKKRKSLAADGEAEFGRERGFNVFPRTQYPIGAKVLLTLKIKICKS
ncbi:hypothetical protein FEM48_Zijuj03G0130200 [Ziziphus jujuba var. spinosa]|uniref:Uncharacterized protein n=1 Tax=Ziziphus jujuba var. spinosa TaxID=714518 RepID=A0A978VQG1_ZIZJJ|nr:hypothetical protein FEM48_Zijuj03G0130200 [Ziziphus jujuba var. spinosa]